MLAGFATFPELEAVRQCNAPTYGTLLWPFACGPGRLAAAAGQKSVAGSDAAAGSDMGSAWDGMRLKRIVSAE